MKHSHFNPVFSSFLPRSLARFGVIGKAIVVVLLLAAPAYAQFGSSFSSSLQKAGQGQYAATGNALQDKILLWTALLNDSGSFAFADYEKFIRENPEWPSMNAMRVKAENVMPQMGAVETIAWFDNNAPQTGNGALRYAEALRALGQNDKARAVLRTALIDNPSSVETLEKFKATGLLKTSDFYARADKVLWKEDIINAPALFPYLSVGQITTLKARMALIKGDKKAAAIVGNVPPSMQNDPGLVYERVRQLRKNDRTEAAIVLLALQPRNPEESEKWGQERSVLVRRLMDGGDYKRAYALSAAHGYKEGVAFANNEFIAGWIALQKLNDPAKAMKHFASLYDNSNSVLSKSRGAYWQARAAMRMGQKELAGEWTVKAAQYTTSFYGQVAARSIGRAPKDFMKQEPEPEASAQSAFRNDERVQAAKLLAENGFKDKAALFLRSLIQKAGAKTDYVMIARYADELNMPQIAVASAKAAALKNMQLPQSGFPVLETSVAGENASPALTHALIRQESQFDTAAASRAGARGLMQLMPATAKQVAGKLGLSHDDSKLTSDPEHNIRLGSSYFSKRVEQFNGSIVLAIASYNAGASNVQKWIAQYGDPRDPKVDVIDWIETIPFYETRNYVQRVVENIEVYRVKLRE